MLQAIVSRKIHGAAGSFDITLFDKDNPLSAPGIESRREQGSAAGNYKFVFTFSNALQSVRTASVSVGSGQVVSSIINPEDDHGWIVNLQGVADKQTIIVTLEGVHDSKDYINVAVPVMILLGDANASGSINATDVSQVEHESGNPVGVGSFRNDLDANGTINATDVSTVKLLSGTAVPEVPASLPRLTVCQGTFLCSEETGRFFWLGDTCWWLMNASDADVSYYLSTRAAQGFNGIQIMALMLELQNSPELALRDKKDFYSNSPKDSQNTLISPLCPNSAYWSRFKWVVEETGRKGLYVGVFLVWGNEIASYFGGTDSASSAKAHDYARDLATLLSSNTNVWYSVSGNTMPFTITSR